MPIKEYRLDQQCAQKIIPQIEPGRPVRLLLWPKDGDGPAEQVDAKCSWELPFPLLRVSDYHCDAQIDGVEYDFKLYSLPWPDDRNLDSMVPSLAAPVTPLKQETLAVFRYEKY